MHIEIVLTLQRDTTIVIILVKFNQEIYIIVADTNLFKNYYTPCIASLYVRQMSKMGTVKFLSRFINM